MFSVRIGQGFDSHAFVEGRPLIIGGVTIPHPKGLKGHSDADVLLHAIIDALIGAAGLGDIGQHFPDTDPHYAGIDSRRLLREVVHLIGQHAWKLGNLDATIIAQTPKMAPHIGGMRENIAADLKVDIGKINIKAKTNERMGFVGREEGVVALVNVLLSRDGVTDSSEQAGSPQCTT